MYRLSDAMDEDAGVTSRVEAMAKLEEMCAKRVVEKSREMRKFHQRLRWRIANGTKVVIGNK